MRHAPMVVLAALLAGCATSTGVTQIGEEYSISSTDKGPAGDLGSLKVAAYKEANAFCAGKGKTLKVLRSVDIPRAFLQFPQTEVQFSCV